MHISKEQYDDIRANRTNGKYPACLLGFAAFGCAFAGSCWRGYAGEEYASMARNSLLRKIEKLREVEFFCSDYRELNPTGSIIYCDPPYRDVSYGYRITGTKGNGKFDSDEFWDVVSRWSKNNIVYVSEYEAPSGTACVFENEVLTSVRKGSLNQKRVERVFMLGDESMIRPCQSPSSAYLGVSDDWQGFLGECQNLEYMLES